MIYHTLYLLKVNYDVCDDDYVYEIKHEKPIFPEDQRVRILKALKVVDDAVLVDIETTNDKLLALDKIHFNVIFSGDDWKGSERYKKTEDQFATRNVHIEYLPYTKGISTSQLVETLKKS